MYVGYSSVFTKQTISKAIVIPILPMQAAMTFSQCMSAEKIHSTHLKVSRRFSKCQLINPCCFRGTSDPVSLDVFKGLSFSCVNEGTGTVSSAGAVAQGPSQSCTGDPGAFRFTISSPTNRPHLTSAARGAPLKVREAGPDSSRGFADLWDQTSGEGRERRVLLPGDSPSGIRAVTRQAAPATRFAAAQG